MKNLKKSKRQAEQSRNIKFHPLVMLHECDPARVEQAIESVRLASMVIYQERNNFQGLPLKQIEKIAKECFFALTTYDGKKYDKPISERLKQLAELVQEMEDKGWKKTPYDFIQWMDTYRERQGQPIERGAIKEKVEDWLLSNWCSLNFACILTSPEIVMRIKTEKNVDLDESLQGLPEDYIRTLIKKLKLHRPKTVGRK